MTTVIADFDEIASAIAADPRAEVLSAAEQFILRQVPVGAQCALDVGCGDGALTRALAARGIATVGIDASPRMIALARSRAGNAEMLEYRVEDFVAGPAPAPEFDVVVCVAMVHHAPIDRVVSHLRAAVAPGGVLIIQDVVNRSGLRYLPLNALAWLARRLRLVPGAGRRSATVDGLYEAHGAGEEFLEHAAVGEVYRRLLPGARVHHHLEWRYTVVWRQER